MKPSSRTHFNIYSVQQDFTIHGPTVRKLKRMLVGLIQIKKLNTYKYILKNGIIVNLNKRKHKLLLNEQIFNYS